MSTCVILNPAAGTRPVVDEIRTSVGTVPDLEIRTSESAPSVGPLVRSAVADGYRRVVAAGGDGTVSAVASALVETGADVTCGILPIGTGNDLAMSLGIPLGLSKATTILRSGGPAPVDAIVATAVGDRRMPERDGGSMFAGRRELLAWNAIVGGFGGRIADRLDAGLKRRWRTLAYVRAAVADLATLSPHDVSLLVDGERCSLELLMLVIANGARTGGGIRFAPGARVDDGWLDIVAIPAMPIRHLVPLVSRVLAGRGEKDPRILRWRGREVSVDAGPGFWFNLDGETWHGGCAQFRLRHHALPFIRP